MGTETDRHRAESAFQRKTGHWEGGRWAAFTVGQVEGKGSCVPPWLSTSTTRPFLPSSTAQPFGKVRTGKVGTAAASDPQNSWEPNSTKNIFSLCPPPFKAWGRRLTRRKGQFRHQHRRSYLLNQDFELDLSSPGSPLLVLPDVGSPGLHLQ